MNSHLEFASNKRERLRTLREIVVDRIGFDLDLARFEPELKTVHRFGRESESGTAPYECAALGHRHPKTEPSTQD